MKSKNNGKAPKNEDDSASGEIKLPALFGVKPGYYLALLYALVLLCAFFFVFFFPGIVNAGGELVVKTVPEGAAVRVDDVYFAATPCAIFVPEGSHAVSIVCEGFEDVKEEFVMGRGVFASLFSPKRLKLEVKLKESAPNAALKAGARDYAAWTFAGEPTEIYQIPLSLSEGAYRSAPRTEYGREEAAALVKAAARFMTTRAAAKDLLRAVFLVYSGGNAASPVTFTAAARGIFDYMRENPDFSVALADILDENAANKLIEAGFYPEVWNDVGAAAEFKPPLDAAPPLPVPPAPFSVENIKFSALFPAASFTQNLNFQHKIQTGAFFMSVDEVSSSQWEAFLRENPEWREENTAALMEAGLVNEDYMVASDDERFPTPSQAGVSFYAARAFCRYLTAKLPPVLKNAGMVVRLPLESEWEYAVKKSAAGGGFTLKNINSLWEWCTDPFAPLNYLKAPQNAIYAVSSPERSVRGGSWANAANEILPDTRASLPPALCSSFVGFRVVIAPALPESAD